uniref:MATH domain-containing protein n=1 Tax=Cannabis sativa TaxID=3483 RepID=A0A803PWQ7_CANSA
MRTKWVIPKYIELKTFNDDSNGYLVNESCAFGAEVFVVKNTFKGECLSMIVDPIETIHTWKFDAISTKNQERYESDPFVGGAYKWRIVVYPNGSVEGKGTHISLFLQLQISSLPPDTKLFVRYVLRLNNQTNNRNNFEIEANRVFSSSSTCWGFQQFMPLAKLKHLENGFILNDTCIIEAECKVLGLIKS